MNNCLECLPNSYGPGESVKKKAREAVNYRVVKGEMDRIGECQVCGKQATMYHHVDGYEKDSWLIVVPLCNRHHYQYIGIEVDLRPCGGPRVRLSKMELRVLKKLATWTFFFETPLPAKTIQESLECGEEYPFVLINRLRAKLGRDAIQTQRGKGYLLTLEVKQ